MITFPSFEKPGKFILFIGLGIILYILNFQIKSGENLDQKIYNSNYNILKLKYEVILDSTEASFISSKIERFNLRIKTDSLNDSDIEAYRELTLLLAKKIILNNERNEEIKFLKTNLNELSYQYDIDSTSIPAIFSLLLGFFIFFFGIWLFINEQEPNTLGIKELRKRVQIATKTGTCQSCGMGLQYDFNPHVEEEFCSNCFDGEKYKEPDLSIEEMSNRIKKKMKEQGIKQKYINKHLSVLKKLNRWTKTLRW